jgi:spermidine synthase
MSDEFFREFLNADSGFFLRTGTLLERFQSQHQLIEVYDTPQWGRLFRLDGCNMTSERDEFIYHENLVHPAALSHPAPRNALVIGGGDGGSSEELLKHRSIERVTLCELDQAVIDISKKYLETVHHRVFDEPKLRVRVEDGYGFLRGTDERFDLIVLDLTDPVGAAAALYTPAFFVACKQALEPGGALTLHIGSPYYQPERFRRGVLDLRSVFAVVRPYLMFIPIYSALWGMAVASDTLDPCAFDAKDVDAAIVGRKLPDLRYYNGAIHHAQFALPNCVAALVRKNQAVVRGDACRSIEP